MSYPGHLYCMKCGESPDNGTHWFSSDGHEFQVPPLGSKWVFKPNSCMKLLVLARPSDNGKEE